MKVTTLFFLMTLMFAVIGVAISDLFTRIETLETKYIPASEVDGMIQRAVVGEP